MTTVPRPYRLSVSDQVLDDFHERLSRTRWPDEVPGSGWRYGSNLDFVRGVVAPRLPRPGARSAARPLRSSTRPRAPGSSAIPKTPAGVGGLRLGGGGLREVHRRFPRSRQSSRRPDSTVRQSRRRPPASTAPERGRSGSGSPRSAAVAVTQYTCAAGKRTSVVNSHRSARGQQNTSIRIPSGSKTKNA